MTTPRRRSGAALLAVASMLGAAACGARVPPYLGPATSQARPGAGGGAAAAGPAQVGAVAGGSGPIPGVGPVTPGRASAVTAPTSPIPGGVSASARGLASGSTVHTTGLTPASFPLDPVAQAALCPPSADNTASDTGITPLSINVGNVSGITGLLANNFEQGPEAVQALFSAINAAGGVCGRRLKLDLEDDGQDSTKNAADIADLIPRSFAFVGSTSDADNGGVPEMTNARIPDVGVAINLNRGQTPVFWTTTGGALYIQGHPYFYDTLVEGLKANGNFPTKIATLAYSVPISADAGKEFANLFVQGGAANCFSDYSVSPASASLDQDVLEIKNKGCDGVYTTMDVTGNAKLLQAIQRQSYHPRFVGTTFDGYTPAQVAVAGQDAAQGFEVTLPFVPFTDANAAMGTYLSELRRYEPGKDPSSFGVEAWAAAEMFVYGLVKAGRNPTRATLVKAFEDIDSWDTGGATAAYTPRLRRPPGPCTVEAVVKGNDFTRKWPPSRFFCAGKLVPVG